MKLAWNFNPYKRLFKINLYIYVENRSNKELEGVLKQQLC